jgi:hypothetical protein
LGLDLIWCSAWFGFRVRVRVKVIARIKIRVRISARVIMVRFWVKEFAFGYELG